MSQAADQVEAAADQGPDGGSGVDRPRGGGALADTRAIPELADVDLSDPDFWVCPPAHRHAVFDVLRERVPFAFFAEPVVAYLEPGPGYHAVTRHADIATISKDARLFSSGQGAVSITDVPPDLNEFFGSLISMDDPRHAKIRRIVSQEFTPRRLAGLVDSVQLIVTDVLDRARRKADSGDGSIDIVADIAAPIPLRIICDMMGIPEADREMVLTRSTLILSGGDPELVEDTDDVLGAFLTAGAELSDLMNRLAAERLEQPTDDLTSALVHSEVDGERLSHQEIASFFILLCVAGNETTRNSISQGLWALHEYPDQRARWMADRELTGTAVEEIVRWASPVTWMRRTATTEVELSGESFPAGSKFVLFYGAANRDPAVFDQPQVFDISRRPNPHVGFGARGPHFCLGAHLARRELEVTFNALFDQLPDLEITGEPDRLRASFVNGIKRLPARLTGAR